jgi:hypothetical protein
VGVGLYVCYIPQCGNILRLNSVTTVNTVALDGISNLYIYIYIYPFVVGKKFICKLLIPSTTIVNITFLTFILVA